MGPLRIPDRRIFIIEPDYSFRNGRERADSRSSRQLKNDYLLSRILAGVFRLLALNEILRNFNNRFVLFNLRHSFSPDFWPEVQLNVKRLAVHILKFLLSYLDECHRSSLHAEKRRPENAFWRFNLDPHDDFGVVAFWTFTRALIGHHLHSVRRVRDQNLFSGFTG